jgi:diketogulonate reductase-like aldo/keto reductase
MINLRYKIRRDKMQNLTLPSGDNMPLLGLGTWQLTGNDCVKSVEMALDLGYRHIDTAKIYGNHKEVAKGINNSTIDRDQIFITSKIWNDSHQYEDVLSSGKNILRELDIEYLDLMLIHWPVEEVPVEETFKGLQELKEDGLIKNIGVSNFMINHLEESFEKSSAVIRNNQIKINPYEFDKNLIDFCQDNNITVTAYSPLARGEIFDDQEILDLSEKVGHSPAQLVLRWLAEKNIIVIPKASSEEHLKDNKNIFDWEFPVEVSEILDSLG